MKNLIRTIAMVGFAILFGIPLISNAQTQETAKTIQVAGSGITRTIEATGNENVKIEGSDINVTITGNCNTITVIGAAIKVRAQSVKVIKIEGADSGVTYKSSPNKNGKAVSSVSGAGSYATKVK